MLVIHPNVLRAESGGETEFIFSQGEIKPKTEEGSLFMRKEVVEKV